MLLLVITNVLLLLVSECFSAGDPPNYFPRCELGDPDLDNCIGKAANTLRSYIRTGIKEIKFPSLEPLVISTINIIQESNLVNYTLTFWNFTVRGLDNYDLTEVRYDPKTMTFNGTMEDDSLSINAAYIVLGTVISIPLEGKGNLQTNFGPFNGTYEINGEIIKRHGVEYYKPTKTKVRLIIGDGSYNLEGLFNGNKELERSTNEMLNRNSKMLTDAITPVFEKLAELGLMYLMKSLTQTVPYNKLFSQSHK